jgi:hypothetical protein
MTLYQFNALRQDDQRTLVTEQGVYLAERQTSRIKAYLFGLNGFYVEILTDAETGEVAWIRSFDRTDYLDPYLLNINCAELFSLIS